jgi:hypothetical protein
VDHAALTAGHDHSPARFAKTAPSDRTQQRSRPPPREQRIPAPTEQSPPRPKRRPMSSAGPRPACGCQLPPRHPANSRRHCFRVIPALPWPVRPARRAERPFRRVASVSMATLRRALWTTSRRAGRGGCFSAKELCRRACSSVRSLLRWTTTSSRDAVPGVIATRDCDSRCGSAARGTRDSRPSAQSQRMGLESRIERLPRGSE